MCVVNFPCGLLTRDQCCRALSLPPARTGRWRLPAQSCSSSQTWALAIPERGELGHILSPSCVCFSNCKMGTMKANCLSLEKIAVRISRDHALRRVVLNLALLPFIMLMSFIVALIFQGHLGHI